MLLKPRTKQLQSKLSTVSFSKYFYNSLFNQNLLTLKQGIKKEVFTQKEIDGHIQKLRTKNKNLGLKLKKREQNLQLYIQYFREAAKEKLSQEQIENIIMICVG